MPAPPYASGMQTPSRCRSAISFRKRLSKRCSRSRSWIRGATSRAAHSRTALSTSLCSSESSKPSIRLVPSFRRRSSGLPPLPHGLALLHSGLQPLLHVLGAHELVQVDVLRVAQRVGEGQVQGAGDGAARGLE